MAYIVPRSAIHHSDQQLYKLPNDLSVHFINKNEVEHLYREIYEERQYLKYGIMLEDGDYVFDVGANIGLFTLFAHQVCQNLKSFAFEPSPEAFKKLSLNIERYGLEAQAFERGLSHSKGTATFTFYPQASMMSGFYADVSEEKRLFKSFMLNKEISVDDHGKALLAAFADQLTEERFDSVQHTCELTTLSEVMRENGVPRIDLLKIDVEKSELDVLSGMSP